MTKISRFLLALFALSATCGCLSAGLKRTPLENWRVRDFQTIGLRVELPRNSLLVDTIGNENTGFILKFYLHYLSSGHFMAEPLYLVSFCFFRFSPEQYDDFRNGVDPMCYHGIWKDHHGTEYDTIHSFRWQDTGSRGLAWGQEALGWRRDYRCSNGDIVVAGVSYRLLLENAEIIAKDTAAIERVLNSVSEIPRKRDIR